MWVYVLQKTVNTCMYINKKYKIKTIRLNKVKGLLLSCKFSICDEQRHHEKLYCGCFFNCHLTSVKATLRTNSVHQFPGATIGTSGKGRFLCFIVCTSFISTGF